MPAVKIPAQRNGWLGFELTDLLAIIGPPDNLTWRVVDANFAFGDEAVSDTWQAVAYDSRLAGGIDVTWEQMEKLAADGGQIVQGTFTGFDGDTAIVQLAAFGRSHWVVWARRASTIERVWGALIGVESYDERVPHR